MFFLFVKIERIGALYKYFKLKTFDNYNVGSNNTLTTTPWKKENNQVKETVFWDLECTMYIEYLEKGKTVTGKY